ncbi:MAG: hypothetical protein HZC55_03960 [Verrucomicrobia bacterium]|nr:hypothetical protein [Verrucomicrobiota bacterium]
MFREFKLVRQERGGRRRWFESPDLDLVVWFDLAGVCEGFQLLFAHAHGERALTWRRGLGFRSDRVTDGDGPLGNESPTLIPEREDRWGEFESRFLANAGSLEPEIHELVLARLRERR